MSHTIRSTAIAGARLDRRVVAVRGRGRRHRPVSSERRPGPATSTRRSRRGSTARVAGTGLVDGVAPARSSSRSRCRTPPSRQSEPRVDALRARSRPHGRLRRRSRTRTATVVARRPRPGEVFLNARGRRRARRPRRRSACVIVYAGRSRASLRVRDVVRYDGRRDGRLGRCSCRSPTAQRLLGAAGSDQAHARLEPRRRRRPAPRSPTRSSPCSRRRSRRLGLEVDAVKQDALERGRRGRATRSCRSSRRSARSRSRPASC